MFSPEIAAEMERIETPYGANILAISGVVESVIETIGGVFDGVGANILQAEPVSLSSGGGISLLSASAPAAALFTLFTEFPATFAETSNVQLYPQVATLAQGVIAPAAIAL